MLPFLDILGFQHRLECRGRGQHIDFRFALGAPRPPDSRKSYNTAMTMQAVIALS